MTDLLCFQQSKLDKESIHINLTLINSNKNKKPQQNIKHVFKNTSFYYIKIYRERPIMFEPQ